MKKALLVAALVCAPQIAHAGFAMKDTPSAQVLPERLKAQPAQTTTTSGMNVKTISRAHARPSLEIINDRYVPDEIEKKYSAPVSQAKSIPAPETAMAMDDMPATAEDIEALPVPNETKNAQVVHTMTITAPPAAAMPEAATMTEPTPLVSVDEVPAVPATDQPAKTSMRSLVVEDKIKKPAIPVPPERFETWRARKGELLRDVLKRWADRSGTDFVWTAAESPKISDDFSYIGSFEEAASRLMAKDAGQLNMKMDGPEDMSAAEPVSLESGTIETASVDAEIAQTSNPVVIQDDTGMMDESDMIADFDAPAAPDLKSFYAAQGSSLKDVLDAWAETEGAKLVWQSADSFSVRESMNEKDGFDGAVGKILTQYEGQKLRPVGQLYKNGVTGEKVLVIRTDKAG